MILNLVPSSRITSSATESGPTLLVFPAVDLGKGVSEVALAVMAEGSVCEELEASPRALGPWLGPGKPWLVLGCLAS